MAGWLVPQTSTYVMSGLASQWKPSTASVRSLSAPCIRLETSTASLESAEVSTAWDTPVVASSVVVDALHPPIIAPATSAPTASQGPPFFLKVICPPLVFCSGPSRLRPWDEEAEFRVPGAGISPRLCEGLAPVDTGAP